MNVFTLSACNYRLRTEYDNTVVHTNCLVHKTPLSSGTRCTQFLLSRDCRPAWNIYRWPYHKRRMRWVGQKPRDSRRGWRQREAFDWDGAIGLNDERCNIVRRRFAFTENHPFNVPHTRYNGLNAPETFGHGNGFEMASRTHRKSAIVLRDSAINGRWKQCSGMCNRDKRELSTNPFINHYHLFLSAYSSTSSVNWV